MSKERAAMDAMTRSIAVVCSEKLYRIREAVAAEPRSPLSDRILRILNDTSIQDREALKGKAK